MSKTKSHNKKKWLPSILWTLGLLLLVGLAIACGFYWNRNSKIEQVKFSGNHYVTTQKLKNQTNIPLGIHPDSLHTTAITQKIEALPYVKTARLEPQPGGTMVINITERTPLALLVNGTAQAYVDADGVFLPKLKGETPDVPLLYGFEPKPAGDTLQSPAFKKVGAFLHALTTHKASNATISEIAWNDDQGIIALTNDNGVKVTIGKTDFNDRLRNWQAFYREVIRQKGMDHMKTIDLRFKGQIVTREN